MTRKRLLMGNWKMYKTATETRVFADALHTYGDLPDDVELVVCPPFTSIAAAVDRLPKEVSVGAQDVHFAGQGAYTGEISADMLADVGVQYVIVGHSERRSGFGESDDWVRQKAAVVAANGMTPVICVGENLGQRESGETLPVVERQVAAGIADLDVAQVGTSIIAYEPVWAIGSGQTPQPGDAEGVISAIREVVAREKGSEAAARVRILYGGSVKPNNIASFADQPNIDGALVGGASLDAGSFAQMAKALAGGGAGR